MDEVTLGGFLGVCGALRNADTCTHPFANTPISMVDVRDVAECAAALLCTPKPPDAAASIDGIVYDVTGPHAVRLGDELARAASALRPRRVTIEPCSVDEYLAPRGLPPAAAAKLGGFLNVLGSQCAATTAAVRQLTGRPPRSLAEHVVYHSAAFLPCTDDV